MIVGGVMLVRGVLSEGEQRMVPGIQSTDQMKETIYPILDIVFDQLSI